MIRLPILRESDLEFYRGKKVIICGCNDIAIALCRVFEYFSIEVIALYSEAMRYERLGRYKGVSVLNEKKLKKKFLEHDYIVIQLTGFEVSKLKMLAHKFDMMGMEVSHFTGGQLLTSFSAQAYLDLYRNDKIRTEEINAWMKHCSKRMSKSVWTCMVKKTQPLIICLPPKTADYTLNITFDKLNNELDTRNINYINVFHKPRFIFKDSYVFRRQKIKIITAVRDPIAQNLSLAFQGISDGMIIKECILGGLAEVPLNEHNSLMERLSNDFVSKDGDMQHLFEMFVEKVIYNDTSTIKPYAPGPVHNFLSEFKKYVADIMDYPFDREKGYTVIKVENIEIFVYQLEKLNDIVPELSNWIGIPFEKLEKGNQASDKWINETYKQALQEIQLTQEYFDRCYDEPYVKHCYSEEDIEKFKARWRPHIKK